MKRHTVSFLLLTVIALSSIFAQPSFEGRLTYVQKTAGGMASETKFVEYYKGNYVVSDMSDIKSKIIYRGDSQELVSIQSMMGTPIVTTMGIVTDVNLHEMDGLEYIEVVIETSNIPINYKGKYYYRSGSTMQELRGPALQQFVLKKMGRSWDDIVYEHATIDDLDRSAIDYFLRKGYENGRITNEERNLPTEILLHNLDLINDEGKLKNAALLLFAKRPQRYFTCVRFHIGRFGVNEADLMFQDVIEGNIIQMAETIHHYHVIKI